MSTGDWLLKGYPPAKKIDLQFTLVFISKIAINRKYQKQQSLVFVCVFFLNTNCFTTSAMVCGKEVGKDNQAFLKQKGGANSNLTFSCTVVSDIWCWLLFSK